MVAVRVLLGFGCEFYVIQGRKCVCLAVIVALVLLLFLFLCEHLLVVHWERLGNSSWRSLV